jgi:hypothetical protein
MSLHRAPPMSLRCTLATGVAKRREVGPRRVRGTSRGCAAPVASNRGYPRAQTKDGLPRDRLLVYAESRTVLGHAASGTQKRHSMAQPPQPGHEPLFPCARMSERHPCCSRKNAVYFTHPRDFFFSIQPMTRAHCGRPALLGRFVKERSISPSADHYRVETRSRPAIHSARSGIAFLSRRPTTGLILFSAGRSGRSRVWWRVTSGIER